MCTVSTGIQEQETNSKPPLPDVSIVIVTYNSQNDVAECLESIACAGAGLKIEVFVVDNASKDSTVRAIQAAYPNVRLAVNDKNLGFPAASNRAIVLASGRYIMLLNPDTKVDQGALDALVSFMDENPDCGICGPVLRDERGRLAPPISNPTCWTYLVQLLQLQAVVNWVHRYRFAGIVSGACLTFRSDLLSTVGLLDESLFWCEDVDFCVRALRAGYRICLVRDACIIHKMGRSGRTNVGVMIENQYKSKVKFLRKHRSPAQVKAACYILISELLLRWVKWSFLHALHRSPESVARLRLFRRLVGDLLAMHLDPTQAGGWGESP